MNKNIIYVIVAIIIVGGGYLLMNRQSPSSGITDQATSDNITAENEDEEVAEVSDNNEAMTEGSVKEFTINASPFSFDLTTLTVKKGDTVRVTVNNTEGMHDFTIDEFNIATKQLAVGESETVEFVADQAGTFEYYCSVGNHRAMGMVGTLTVE